MVKNRSRISLISKQTGIPQSIRDAFELLFKAALLSEDVAVNLKKMGGLSIIAFHDYQELNIDIVTFIIENHLVDFQYFIKTIKLIPSL